MTLIIECESCSHVIKVKDEFAGRKVRCPGCQAAVDIPSNSEDAVEEQEAFKQTRASRSKKRSRQPEGVDRPWYFVQWHWLVVLAILLLALWPARGLVFAGTCAAAGAVMALVGGVVPFFRIIAGAPGTVLQMIVSRRARFEMMDQPDSHPYKVLVRTAFNPTRGLFWRGVLLIVTFIPAAFLNSFASEWFKRGGLNVAPAGGPQRTLRPGMPVPNQGVRPADASLLSVTIRYNEFSGSGSATDKAMQALATLPGYVPDSAVVDESEKTIRFEHQGHLAAPAVMPLFSRSGFRSLNFHASTKKP